MTERVETKRRWWAMRNLQVLSASLPAISQFHNHAQSLKAKNSRWPLDSQTWQTKWKTAPLAKLQLRGYEDQTLKAFVASSRLYAKFHCPVAHQKFQF